MSNVLKFRSNALRAHTESPLDANDARPAIPDMVERVTRLQSKAKMEISKSILMLDLAAQHARQIAARIIDPNTRAAFEMHVASIEHALQIARERARRL